MNGLDVSDSQFSIEYLAKKFNKDLSADLSIANRAIARSIFKMVEESLKWCMFIHRFIYGKPEECDISWILQRFIAFIKYDKASKFQGYGLHTKTESNTNFRAK